MRGEDVGRREEEDSGIVSLFRKDYFFFPFMVFEVVE